MLKRILAVPGHEFWVEEVAPVEATTFATKALVGHRQVTDAYLLALVQGRSGKLATFDRGVAELLSTPEREQCVTIIEDSGAE